MAKKSSQSRDQKRLFEERLVPAKPGSDRLFEVAFDAASQPVECLGMTFPNEDARRTYFLEKLREKLKDPAFRTIEGFPIGEDEDILAISDPPYYTACPNPFLAEAVSKQRPQVETTADQYHREPFSADVSEGRTNSIYTGHTYHTKVPPAAVAAYLFHYTEPGDVVLDVFSGSGMTGVGGMLCSSPALAAKYEGKPGARTVILCDLSPAATFISSVYLNPPEPSKFETAAQSLLESTDRDIGKLWTLSRNGRTYQVEYHVWAELFACPNCQKEITTQRHSEATETIGASNEFPCPSCGTLVSKAPAKGTNSIRLERLLKTKFDKSLQRSVQFVPRVPLFAFVAKGKTRERLDLTPEEANRLQSCEPSTDYWFPTDPAVKGEDFTIKHCLHSFGISHIHHFYLPRQLSTYSCMWHHALQIKDHTLRNALLFYLSSNALGMTMMNRYRVDAYSQVNMYMSGVLYLPSTTSETGPSYCYRGKKDRLVKAFALLKEVATRQYAITTQSSTSLAQIPSESVDYVFTDPPFGRNIPYSELNQIWEAWLKTYTNRSNEAIIDQTLDKDVFAYGALIRSAFHEVYRVLKPGRWATVVFHNSHNAVWFVIQEALLASGLVVADVRTLDRQMETYKQSRQKIVKQDLVISAYKPPVELEKAVLLKGTGEEAAWEFVRSHLAQLPVFKGRGGKVEIIAERQGYLLFDRMVAFFVQREIAVPISAAEFHLGLQQRFPERDGMFFLSEQVSEYDGRRLESDGVEQPELFVSDEKTAIQWVRQRLFEKPMSYQELQPLYMKEAQRVWDKHEYKIELLVILEQNFVKDEGDRWHVSDPKNETHLAQIRHRALIKEFQQYLDTKGKLKVVRTEALRGGFKEAWQKKDYTTIVQMAKRVPEAVILEDQALLMYFDNASLMLGE